MREKGRKKGNKEGRKKRKRGNIWTKRHNRKSWNRANNGGLS